MRTVVSRFLARHGFFVVLAAVLLPVYWWQLKYGVDISDEGYYAVLPVSWLRSTPADTGNLSPHQFSAVLYFPLVKAYSLAHPDLSGLILFLRRAYLCGSFLFCLSGYRFFSRVSSPAVAAAAALALFVYIPLGLPAVSYNTLALFGIGGGLFTLARALLDREITGVGGWVSMALGAGLMAVGGCAYPSVALLAPLALAALFWLFPAQRRFTLTAFLAWVGCTGLLLALIAAQLGGPERLADVFDFSRKLYAGSMGEKAESAGVSLYGKGQLLLPCALMLLLGVARRIFPSAAFRPLHLVGCVAVVGWWLTCNRPTGLFTKGHDVVFLFCAAFLPLLPLPRQSLPAGDRLLAVLFVVGVIGGGLVASSAVAGLINFPVLGILAVASGLALAARGHGTSEAMAAGACGVVASIAWATLTYVYAEVPLASPTVQLTAYPARIKHGPYAGLRTQPWKRDLLENVGNQLKPYESRCRTADFWMSSSGLYLLTPFELRTPMPYWLEDVKTTHLHDTLREHYTDPANRPDLVVLWTMTQEQDTKVDREQLSVLAEHYTEQPAQSPIRIFVRKDLAE
jgi:hypothetical protein